MNRHRILLAPLAAVLAAGLPLVAFAGDGHDHAAHAAPGKETGAASAAAAEGAAPTTAEAVIADQLPTYPLTTCVVSGEDLGAMGKAVDFVHEGRLVRFCCPNCEKQFLGDPAKYLAKVDAAVIEAQLPDYPMTACPVSGKELGAMGEPYDHVSGTRLVRFCCGGCLETFNGDPAAYLAKIDAAAEATAQAEAD